MSTSKERRDRAKRYILPVKIKVRQPDGTYHIQTIDADVRQDKRTGRKVK